MKNIKCKDYAKYFVKFFYWIDVDIRIIYAESQEDLHKSIENYKSLYEDECTDCIVTIIQKETISEKQFLRYKKIESFLGENCGTPTCSYELLKQFPELFNEETRYGKRAFIANKPIWILKKCDPDYPLKISKEDLQSLIWVDELACIFASAWHFKYSYNLANAIREFNVKNISQLDQIIQMTKKMVCGDSRSETELDMLWLVSLLGLR